MSPNTDGHSVCAIIVTYQPEPSRLKELVSVLLPQVSNLIVVDNGSDQPIAELIGVHTQGMIFSLLELNENLGVAAAQNRGIQWARARNCSHVVTLDQDSTPSPDMVKKLLGALIELQTTGISVAAVGPRLIDRRTRAITPFVRIGLLGIKRQGSGGDGSLPIVETDFLVSSGMLIPLEVLTKVGPLEEALFIDNVDLEWCFRARGMGLGLYGVHNAEMEHSVGDHVIKLGSYVIHLHPPYRQYYIMRNRILLYKRHYSPWEWKVQDFVRMVFKFGAFALFFSPRRQNLAMMLKGIRDGLSGKTGKLR